MTARQQATTHQSSEQDYFTNYDAPVSTQLIDASYLKLREVELLEMLCFDQLSLCFQMDSAIVRKACFQNQTTHQ